MQEVARTETINNNNSPTWQRPLIVDKKPGENNMKLKFEVFDWDNSSNRWGKITLLFSKYTLYSLESNRSRKYM